MTYRWLVSKAPQGHLRCLLYHSTMENLCFDLKTKKSVLLLLHVLIDGTGMPSHTMQCEVWYLNINFPAGHASAAGYLSHCVIPLWNFALNFFVGHTAASSSLSIKKRHYISTNMLVCDSKRTLLSMMTRHKTWVFWKCLDMPTLLCKSLEPHLFIVLFSWVFVTDHFLSSIKRHLPEEMKPCYVYT